MHGTHEEEFRSWELAPPGQRPGTMDRYRARMQELVGPMVFQDTLGEQFCLFTRRDRV